MSADNLWWSSLRHGGLLIAPSRLALLRRVGPEPITEPVVRRLRADLTRLSTETQEARKDFLDTVFQKVCGLGADDSAEWRKGNDVPPGWSRRGAAGDTLKPRRIWLGPGGGVLPVFVDEETRLGVGRGRRMLSRVLEWLRATDVKVAVLTNHTQFRLVYAGADYDAWAEWDTALWFEEGQPSPQVQALRWLLAPETLTPRQPDGRSPLLDAIEETRKGQAELSATLGERVRLAVEALIQSYGDQLAVLPRFVEKRHIYIAATRIVMRMVVVLFAEARELLPRDNPRYESSYGLQGLRASLERVSGGARARRSLYHGAWARVLSLFGLVFHGSHHPQMLIRRYGGGLFTPGNTNSEDPIARALAVLEDPEHGPHDNDVATMLDFLCRTEAFVQVGTRKQRVMVPVDFSDLSSEYIGILYEGLLDYELRQAEAQQPLVFLAVGDQPVLPLSRLEEMGDEQIAGLVEKMKKSRAAVSSESEDAGDDEEPTEIDSDDDGAAQVDAEPVVEAPEAVADDVDALAATDAEPDAEDEPSPVDDATLAVADAAHEWAIRAVRAGGLVRRPRGRSAVTLAAYQEQVAATARTLISRIVMPGEWFLVLWGGTRKGSGTFYTRPQLAVPTVQRTLRELAYDTPAAGEDAPLWEWSPKTPDAILSLKVCDPAVGSGSFAVAALRFLADALWRSLLHHQWLVENERGFHVQATGAEPPPWFSECVQDLPVTAGDAEVHVRARLRRVAVERCIYGVDLDPLAIELARLSLWVETMNRDLPFEFLDHRLKVGNALVGCWFDRFRDYPVMAWMREGGDSTLENFVHHYRMKRIERGRAKGTEQKAGDKWTQAIKEWRDGRVRPALVDWITGQQNLAQGANATAAERTHDEAVELLRRMEAVPMHEPEERARFYHENMVNNAGYRALMEAFDSWCALWFWPADRLESAPLPDTFGNRSEDARTIVRALRHQHRFFHWELEFPDVFAGRSSGFDAMFGNPPWETQKPNSKEFFSNIDPLYRSYGKQEALKRQTALFGAEPRQEMAWVEYSARYKALSNWAAHAAFPFGDADAGGESYSFGKASAALHTRWSAKRSQASGYADARHPFRHQGSADLNTYKMFLEQTHALLREGGRVGMIVPSGVYTDKGSTTLRSLFLDKCQWNWLFGFENRQGIFDIHRSFKFAPVIVTKGGRTQSIRAAFMRHDVRDWAEAEKYAVSYPRQQVERFSPNTRSILEVGDKRDLEVLEKIYANSMMLGEKGPDGWGISYAREFDMTNDSKLFPPRAHWEAQGYRPDEYGRWVKFSESQAVDRHANEVGWVRLADSADVVHESVIEDIALPLYEGRMIGQFDYSAKGWVSGRGRRAVWTANDYRPSGKLVRPQYLMSEKTYFSALLRAHIDKVRAADGEEAAEAEQQRLSEEGPRQDFLWSLWSRVGFMDVSSSTNARTMIATAIPRLPAGNKVPLLRVALAAPWHFCFPAVLNSVVYDYSLRCRLGGLSLNYFILAENPLPKPGTLAQAMHLPSLRLCAPAEVFAPMWMLTSDRTTPWRKLWAVSPHERLRIRVQMDAAIAAFYGLDAADLRWILRDVDHPAEVAASNTTRGFDPKGFWRIDKTSDPELRQTVLTLVAYCDLMDSIRSTVTSRADAISSWLTQGDGNGWMLPEEICLADYGLGRDERARKAQPVRRRLGERFFPWQLEQDPEESWSECERHARNLLGERGLSRLLSAWTKGTVVPAPAADAAKSEERVGADANRRLPLF
jgi:hypothetical protein